MHTEKPKKVSEKRVVQAWRQQVKRRRHWLDSAGNPLEIIYPGRPNDGRGADFRDGIIAGAEGVKKGGIEVHLHTRGWLTHRHHLDPVYNNVVLHVALSGECPAGIVTQKGETIPTVILEKLTTPAGKRNANKQSLPCQARAIRLGPARIVRLLERAGGVRFKDRGQKFALELEDTGDGQCLYQGIMQALGYSKNQAPFLKLARLISLQTLEGIARNNQDRQSALIQMQSLLIGTAGLMTPAGLPAGLIPEHLLRLEDAWLDTRSKPGLDISHWELFRLHPGNHPVRRLMALSQLVYTLRTEGLLQFCLRLIQDSETEFCTARFIRAWTAPGTLGESTPGAAIPVTAWNLGRDRAAEILINVVLPFAWARGKLYPQSGLCRKSLKIYRAFPRLGQNSIERHMLEQLSLDPKLIQGARHQQGLLHLYKSFCSLGRCGECELARN